MENSAIFTKTPYKTSSNTFKNLSSVYQPPSRGVSLSNTKNRSRMAGYSVSRRWACNDQSYFQTIKYHFSALSFFLMKHSCSLLSCLYFVSRYLSKLLASSYFFFNCSSRWTKFSIEGVCLYFSSLYNQMFTNSNGLQGYFELLLNFDSIQSILYSLVRFYSTSSHCSLNFFW